MLFKKLKKKGGWLVAGYGKSCQQLVDRAIIQWIEIYPIHSAIHAQFKKLALLEYAL